MNNIKTTLLLATLTAILVVIGDMIGGRSGMIMMFVISMGMNFMSYLQACHLHRIGIATRLC